MKAGKRVTLRLGKHRKTVLLMDRPFPEKGDIITIEGQDWNVASVKDEPVYAKFEEVEGKLKQVFP